MEYIIQEYFTEVHEELMEHIQEKSLKYIKENLDKLVHIIVSESIKLGYDLREFDIHDKINIPDKVDNDVADALFETYVELSIYIGSAILDFAIDEIALGRKKYTVDVWFDKLITLLESIGIPDEEQYGKLLSEFKNKIKENIKEKS